MDLKYYQTGLDLLEKVVWPAMSEVNSEESWEGLVGPFFENRDDTVWDCKVLTRMLVLLFFLHEDSDAALHEFFHDVTKSFRIKISELLN